MTGFTKVDNDILEEVSRRKFNASQLSVLMVVWRMTFGYGREDHELAVKYFVEVTGFSKRNIQETINSLIENKVLIETQQASFNKTRKIAFNRNRDEWTVDSRTIVPQVKDCSPHEQKVTSPDDESFTSPGEESFTSPGEESFTHKRKVKESKRNTTTTDFTLSYQFYEKNIGMLSPFQSQELISFFEDFDGQAEVLNEAVKIACDRNRKTFSFVKMLLNQWLQANAKTVDSVKAYEVSKFNSSQSKGQSVQRVSQRPSHWKKPERLTEEERKEMAELEAQMPF